MEGAMGLFCQIPNRGLGAVGHAFPEARGVGLVVLLVGRGALHNYERTRPGAVVDDGIPGRPADTETDDLACGHKDVGAESSERGR